MALALSKLSLPTVLLRFPPLFFEIGSLQSPYLSDLPASTS